MARTRAEGFEAKRRAILAAAAAVFAREGMERASMARVAEAAGVSKALLYHYWPGKDAMVFSIIAEHLEALDTRLAAADDPAAAPEARLRALVGAVLDGYRGADDRHKVQLGAAAALAEDRRAEIAAIERRIVGRFAVVIALLNPALDDPAHPRLTPATMTLFGVLNWVWTWFRDDGPMGREAYADLATDIFLNGVGAVR